jgi:hypothetical protein
MRQSLLPDPVSALVNDVTVLEWFEPKVGFCERDEGLIEKC